MRVCVRVCVAVFLLMKTNSLMVLLMNKYWYIYLNPVNIKNNNKHNYHTFHNKYNIIDLH